MPGGAGGGSRSGGASSGPAAAGVSVDAHPRIAGMSAQAFLQGAYAEEEEVEVGMGGMRLDAPPIRLHLLGGGGGGEGEGEEDVEGASSATGRLNGVAKEWKGHSKHRQVA
jgi:hypothetical protein